jgi:hypothetical protein
MATHHNRTAEPPDASLAAYRVGEYLRQREAMPRVDPNEIGSIHTDMAATPASLFIADLCALVDAARRTVDG